MSDSSRGLSSHAVFQAIVSLVGAFLMRELLRPLHPAGVPVWEVVGQTRTLTLWAPSDVVVGGEEVVTTASGTWVSPALRPLNAGSTVSWTQLTELAAADLPGVSATTARRLAEAGGQRFTTLGVPGVGPATAARIDPYIRFNADAPEMAPVMVRVPDRTAKPRVRGGGGVVTLNGSSARQWESVVGIGPTLARRIVAAEAERGPFRAVDDLLLVPGIGPKLLERIRPSIRALGESH